MSARKKLESHEAGRSRHTGALKTRYKALGTSQCKLAALYVATLPDVFRNTNKADALDDVREVLAVRHEFMASYKARMAEACSPDDAANNPLYTGHHARYEALKVEANLVERFRDRFTGFWSSGPTEKDVAWLSAELKKHRNSMHQKVKDQFAHLATLPDWDPYDDDGLHAGGASSRTHGQPSQSLAKPRFRPLPRRETLLQ
ncbi:hypothetical protein JCM16303_004203 [Sporobolomyces ruberrimus]